MFETIMVATDGSRAAQKAVAFAAQFAKRHNSKLVICTVSHRADAVVPGRAEPDRTPEDDTLEPIMIGMGNEILKRAVREARRAGVTEYQLIDVAGGNIGATICKQADAVGADHIVVGSLGATGLKRLLLGSTADSVIHYAKCPVTVVR